MITYGAVESGSKDPVEQKRHDETLNKEILCEGVAVHAVQVEVRLGMATEGRGGQRPMLVRMRNAKERFEVLKNARNIRRAREERVRRGMIAPEMTKKTRS